jgi:hypothetical protein
LRAAPDWCESWSCHHQSDFRNDAISKNPSEQGIVCEVTHTQLNAKTITLAYPKYFICWKFWVGSISANKHNFKAKLNHKVPVLLAHTEVNWFPIPSLRLSLSMRI